MKRLAEDVSNWEGWEDLIADFLTKGEELGKLEGQFGCLLKREE